MNMKKLVAMLLALVMVFALCACGGDKDNGGKDSATYKVAMITDYGDITDQSFNQTTYEACKAFCTENNIEFTYYKPAGDSTPDRIAMVEKAVDEGYNVIVMPGYAFGGAIVEAAPQYKDIKFVALDVAKDDLLETAVAKAGETYDFNPDNWELSKYFDMSNVYCAVYQEELCGYMAGYAAVKLGYTELGFLGGMAVPAVIRYGYGFVQGANAAAAEMDVQVEINYSWQYGSSYAASPELQTMANGWYVNGTEVIFACGGTMFNSITAAASANDGYVVGVDVDQSSQSDTVVTSAMKGIGAAAQLTISKYYDGTWDEIGGKNTALGVADDAVGLPTDTWSLTGLTVEEYQKVYDAVKDGSLVIDTDYETGLTQEWSNVTLNII